MKKRGFVLGIISITLVMGLFLVGCASSGFVNDKIYNTPRMERCILKVSGTKAKIYFNEDSVSGHIGTHYFVIPAGKHKISATEEDRYIISGGYYGSTSTTYIPYIESWSSDLEFEAGKTYEINLSYAYLRYDNRNLSTGTAGVTINSDGYGRNISVSHEHNSGITISEIGSMPAGSKLSPHSTFYYSFGFYDYGPSFITTDLGYTLGLELISGNFQMLIGGTAGVDAGFASPSSTFGFQFGYSYGGLADFSFSWIGFGVEVGMNNGVLVPVSLEDSTLQNQNYSFPYLEASVVFHGFETIKKVKPYFRYNFTGENEWYNKFGIGVKLMPR